MLIERGGKVRERDPRIGDDHIRRACPKLGGFADHSLGACGDGLLDKLRTVHLFTAQRDKERTRLHPARVVGEGVDLAVERSVDLDRSDIGKEGVEFHWSRKSPPSLPPLATTLPSGSSGEGVSPR